MPFGADVQADKKVRFRLLAPKANSVDVSLNVCGERQILAMTALEDGWFEATTDQAAPGDTYSYRINGEIFVPDPASRFQSDEVHGCSQIVDPKSFFWSDVDWYGRPWEDSVIYELHIGCFTPEGSFEAASAKLKYLAELGVTAVQLMPVAQFPGRWNWGYDGVLPFAVEARYGTHDDLKRLIQAAHELQLMVFIDVVYNHFGPEGNYLHTYAPSFFTDRHKTPWGDGINFDGAGSHWVRQFFIHNALYWIEEYHVDGLRLDAVHAILDNSMPSFLEELADTIQQTAGFERQIHLVLENDANSARYLARDSKGRVVRFAAQWNDDFHHAFHVLLTGETNGYYCDYTDDPVGLVGRCLTEGFAYQGQASTYRNGVLRGEPSRQLPPTAFVNFLQNHDQIGNRALGERITALAEPDAIRAAAAILLVAPSPPLIFMGEEWGSRDPFVYFCDFEPDLMERVCAGRRQEFGLFSESADASSGIAIPDPSDSFESCCLNWELALAPEAGRWRNWYTELLALRSREIVPRLRGVCGDMATFARWGVSGLHMSWKLGDGSVLSMLTNLGNDIVATSNLPEGRFLYMFPSNLDLAQSPFNFPAWSVVWFLAEQAPS